MIFLGKILGRWVTAILLFVILLGLHLLGLYRWVDVHYASEKGADLVGEWVFDEDWAVLNAHHLPMDYQWLRHSFGTIYVSHALGGAGTAEANTLMQMQQSHARGLRVMEVDIWRAADDTLFCHHGPNQPSPSPHNCRFEEALQYAVDNNLWLILDIKTAFEPTARLLLQRLNRPSDASHVVFQLYKPEDYTSFVQWQQTLPLAGPILTGYLSRRSGNHLLQQAQRLGVMAVTLPLHRLRALGQPLPIGVALFTHPVHDCNAHEQARDAGVSGMYIAIALENDIKWVNQLGSLIQEGRCSGAI